MTPNSSSDVTFKRYAQDHNITTQVIDEERGRGFKPVQMQDDNNTIVFVREDRNTNRELRKFAEQVSSSRFRNIKNAMTSKNSLKGPYDSD